jgi:hypothetical protein
MQNQEKGRRFADCKSSVWFGLRNVNVEAALLRAHAKLT